MQLADRPHHPIHDLFVRQLAQIHSSGLSRLRLVGHSDHLLRRFGWAELLRLTAGETIGPTLQPVADEVWILESGEAEVFWRDQRSGSPSQGKQHHVEAKPPLMWLVPFGVLFGVRSRADCLLIRLSSHEPEPGVPTDTPAWPEDW